MQAILKLPKATFYKYRNHPESARLDKDQLTRISYLLNIHKLCGLCLKTRRMLAI
ncbi:hypothetical protein ACU6TU_08885 [Halomonas sp. LS-001]